MVEDSFYKNGAVSSKHPLSTGVGVDILKRGGNAVDSAVATAFAVGVVEPGMSGIGGGGGILVDMASTEEIVHIDYVPRVSHNAESNMFQLEEGVSGAYGWPQVRNAENLVGYRSACTPGTIAGLSRALEKFGTMELHEVLEPAIKLAEKGFPITSFGSICITQTADALSMFPESAKIFFRNGRFPLMPAAVYPSFPADNLVQRDLASTLRKIAADGPDAFYKGEIADSIVEDMENNGGIINSEDLRSYDVRTLKPVIQEYRDHQVVGLRTHGGPTVMEMLNIMSTFPIPSMNLGSFEMYRIFAESMNYAFKDRLTSLWDMDSEDVQLNKLLSMGHAEEIKREIEKGRTMGPSHEDQEKGHTTHLSTADKDGNVVSLTQTLLDLFGSKVTIKGTGIVMNNGMAWFNPKPGSIASIKPGKIPMSAYCPTIILKKGKPVVSLGSIGYRRIIGAVGQITSYIVDYGMDIQTALNYPRIDFSSNDLIIDGRVESGVAKKFHSEGYPRPVSVVDDIASVNFSSPGGVMVHGKGKIQGGTDLGNPDSTAGGY